MTPEKPGQDSLEVVKEAHKLKPWKLMQKRDLVGAVKAAQALLQVNPNDVSVTYCAAIVLKNAGSLNDAMTQMKQALALAPRNKELRLEYARMLVETKKLDDALVQYRWVIKEDPKASGPRMELAQLFLSTERPAECAAELEDFVTAFPNDVEAHKIRGIALARSGKAQEGMDEYLLGVSSEHGAGQSEAVKFIIGSWGDLAKARYDLERQTMRSPEDYLPRLRLAQICLYTEHPQDALPYLLEARKLEPYNSEIQRTLCVAYKRSGDNVKALTAFLQSVALEQEQSKKTKVQSK